MLQERAVLEKMLDEAKTSGELKTAQEIKDVSFPFSPSNYQ